MSNTKLLIELMCLAGMCLKDINWAQLYFYHRNEQLDRRGEIAWPMSCNRIH